MYVVPRPRDRWELRESCSTPNGPRSRTLASFRVLTPAVAARAAARAGAGRDRASVRRAALRAGAPVEDEPGDEAARLLLTAIGEGRGPASHWQRLLRAALPPAGGRRLSDSERAALPWLSATPSRRGRALADLLGIVDAIPRADREPEGRRPLRFPGLRPKPMP